MPVLSVKPNIIRTSLKVVFATLILCLAALVLPTTPSHAQESISVAYSIDSIPFHFQDKDGQPAGMIIDIWKRWSDKTGIKIDFVPTTWDGTLKLVRENKVDAHAGLFYSKERDAYMDYGKALTKTDAHIFYHESLPQLVAGKELLPYRVGVIAGDFVETYLREHVPNIIISSYPDYDSLMTELRDGSLKTFAADTPTALYNLKKYGLTSEFQFHATRPLYQNDWFVAVPEGMADTLSTIDEGMDKITLQERTSIVRNWSEAGDRRDTNTLVIAIDRGYTPIFFIGTDGKPKGLAVDIWNLWSEKVGRKIDFRPSNWPETLEAIKTGQADIHGGLFLSEERSRYMDFANSYYELSTGLFFKKGRTYKSLTDLLGKPVGVVTGTLQESYVRASHPSLELIGFESPEDSILALLKGDVDAVVEEVASVESLTQKLGLRGVLARASGLLMTNDLHPGVVKGNEELRALVNSGLGKISKEEFAFLEERWIANPANRHYAASAASRTAALSSEEIAWIKQNPKATITVMESWPPISWVNRHGKVEGIDIDILKLVSERLGMELEIVPMPFKEGLAAVRDKKIDAIAEVTRKPEREEFLNFTRDYLHIPHVIVARSDGPVYDNENMLKGKTIALERGFYNVKYFKQKYPEITVIEMDDTRTCLVAVSEGKVDAYAGNRAVIQHLIAQELLNNLQIQGRLSTRGSVLAIGTRKDRPMLAQVLDKGLATINLRDRSQLVTKYINRDSALATRKRVNLDDSEVEWLDKHPDIRLGLDQAWPPIEFFRNGSHSGLSAEYVRRLGEDTGLTFAKPSEYQWSEVVRLAKNKELDLLPAVSATKERSEFLAFSKPYATYPIVIYQRTDDIPVKSMADLEGRTIAVVRGYAISEHIRNHHSGIERMEYATMEEALEALARGKVTALAGNLIVVEDMRQRNSIYNVAPVIKTPYTQELRFGVRKDWPELVRIIDKWLDTVTIAQRRQMEQSVGIESDVPFLSEGIEAPIDFMQLILLGAGLIVVFAVAMLIFLFIRRALRSKAETLYSSHQYKVVGIIVGLLFLCLVVVATWYALHQVETRVRNTGSAVLESILLSTHEALALWARQHEQGTMELADTPALRGLTAGLLTLPPDREVIESSPQLWNLRKLVGKFQKSRKFVDYAIVSKNKLNYAAQHDHDLLDKNTISIQRPRLLDKVFLGNTIFIPPIKVFEKEGGTKRTVVSIATPISASGGEVLAALVLNFDASHDYQRIIEMGRVGMTGETYAVDRKGSLVSKSRFLEKIQELGLLQEDQPAILNLRIADPGGNLETGHVLDKEIVLPLTFSAKNVTERRPGMSMKGYRDYRGVQVFGTWLWDSKLGVGLITEIDENEALGSYRLVRNTVIAVILITILLGSLMTGLSNWIGQSAARSLSKAKDELEDRVEERTAELKKITVAVEQSPATVVITDIEGTIQYVNPKFTDMTGYTSEEAIGLNPRVLKSGEHPAEFYETLWATITSGKAWTGDFHNRRKNGELFWERAHIAPITGDDNEITHFVAVKEDITDRKAQEERFQALLDAAPDAMVIVERDGTIALVNIATEELFEYPREELVGQKVEILLPEWIREKHPEYREKFFNRPGDLSLVENKNFRGQTKSGVEVPVDIGLSPFETSDGLQVIASIRDITERQKQEAALKESEERTRLILSSAGEGIFGVNLEGQVMFINQAACAMLGYKEHEIMGSQVHELIHHTKADGSHYPVEECPMRDAFMLGVSSRIDDEVLWRKDGTSFDVEYSAVPILREGEKVGAVISFADISQRRAAEQALKESEERFRGYFEHAQVGMTVTHPDKGWLEVNATLQNMLGYTLDELRQTDWVKLTHPDDLDEDLAHYGRLVEGEIDNYSLDKRFIRKDGEIVYTNLAVSAVRDEEGTLLLVLASLLDITDRKQMEIEIIEAKAIAEDALTQVTSSIQYASRIQRSTLPPEYRLNDLTVDHFVVWEPRDVVGGDLYWCELWGEGAVIILGDCTGHGVPGAFMTLIATGALKRGLSKVEEGDCAGLISSMHKDIQMQLGQHRDDNGDGASDDGLELGVCYLAPDNTSMTFAGARMPLFIYDGETIDIIKGDKKGIGYRAIPLEFEYTNKSIHLGPMQHIYMTTDGLIDQVGGEKRRGYGKKRFIALLESLRDTPMADQGGKIYAQLLTYQGKETRRDDVSIIGFTI